jgi:hypothetical protein
MEERLDIDHRIDARLAAWISSASPCAAGHYLYSGASLPDAGEKPPGNGFGWEDRASAATLRECYRTSSLDPHLERAEAAAISVLPEPEEEDEDTAPALPFRPPSPHERWEQAVSSTAKRVSGFLRYGPTASFSGGKAVFAGGDDVEAEVSGLKLRQWIDLLWRHPDGSMEAILVIGEPNSGMRPPPAGEDWQCILAAAIVRSVYGSSPRVHLVRVSAGVAQTVRFPEEELERKISNLARDVSGARGSRGCGEAFTYPITVEAVEPLQKGGWPRGRPLPPGMPR